MTRYRNDFGRIAQNLAPKAHALVDAATMNILGNLQRSMEGIQPPSAPGSPPAIRTGYLRGSYQRRPAKYTPNGVVGYVYTSAEYGPHLELGTIFMAPRPHLKPAADAETPGFNLALRTLFHGR